MTPEGLSFESLLHGEFEHLFHPAEARRRIARLVPHLVAGQLVGPVDPGARAEWVARFVQGLWPALHAERGHKWDLGWDALVAGFATSIELLAGALPASVRHTVEGTPAQALWESWRRPYSRYALLLDGRVLICRVFVTASRCIPGELVEKTVPWRHDGPTFHGRSHTLLLALMAEGLLPETMGPLAATGELDADVRTVRPVLGLVDKAMAWRQSFPDGVLVTGPLGGIKNEDWQTLAGRKGYRPIDAALTDRWLTGGSIAELEAKLNAPPSIIKRWDGAVLDEAGIAEAQLECDPKEAPEGLLHDALLDAAWAASQHGKADGVRRGLLIEGPPGAGKSTLSRVLEQRFRSGLLGALGFGVRRSARELAEDLRQASARTWPEVLAVREPERRTLFEELERTARLVPIVDGLDELGSLQVREVAALLRASPVWWMATTRPVASIPRTLPPAWLLRVREPSREDGRKLLAGAGRADLAERLYGDAVRQGGLPESLSTLIRTPLHLTLLAQVIRQGEAPELLADHALYQRVFEGLLDQACHEQRLTEHDARKLRELRADAIGELALVWLRESGGALDGTTVDLILEEAGFKASERPELMRALEFGHLLAPVGDAWDFAHRTVAEWSASEALHRQVLRRQREHARASGTSDDRAQRARIELELLAPFLEMGGGSWAQLLRFYAPHISEPLALLERLTDVRRYVGRSKPHWRTGQPTPAADALDTWDFTFELLSRAVWKRPQDARLAWGIAVRRWLLFEYSGDQSLMEAREVEERELTALKAMSRAVASHLPRSLPELLAIAGRTEAQRARLAAEPALLLSAIPPSHASALDPLLKGDSRKAQWDVLTWYAEHGLEVDGGLLDTLIHDLPAEVSESETSARDEERTRRHEVPGAPLPKVAHRDMLRRLESLVWETSLRTRQALPWPQVRVRLQRWPPHLESIILRWFGMRAGERDAPAEDLENRHRREVLAASLEEATAVAGQLVSELKRLQSVPGGPDLVGHLWRWLDDSEDRHIQRLLGELAAKADWEPPRSGRGGSESQALEDGLRQLYRIRQWPVDMLKALDETRLGPVVGELWKILSPEQPEREALLQAIEAAHRPPAQLPARLLLERQGEFSYGLEQTLWAPSHLAELHELSATGPGALRFVAICLLAKLEKRDETLALLQAVPLADEALLERIRHHLKTRGGWEARVPTELLPLEVLVQLPLEDRVEREVPGWRSDLIAHLAGPSDDVGRLAMLAAQKGVREALPLLGERLTESSWVDSRLIQAIALLCTPADERWARVALHHALLHGWPDGRAERHRIRRDKDERAPAGEALAGFLTLEDLDLLARGSRSALPHPSLADAIRRLGSEGRERLLTRYREASEEVARLEPNARSAKEGGEPPRGDKDARQRRTALAETLVVSLPASGRLADLVDLAFQVAGGDVHLVYGMPGPLGSDFDEPGDLDWHSDQENAALIEAFGRQMEDCLSREPESWPVLRRLFLHPSETLRLMAFERCADRASPHEVAELALAALEGHARTNRTRWTGPTAAYRLSGGGGAGTSYVAAPDTLGRLADSVRKRLTPAHRRVIEALVVHELPIFRALAAQWTGQLGNASWCKLIRPLLEDPVPGVVHPALDALLLLAPEALDEGLRQADRSAWTSRHDTGVLLRLRTPKQPSTRSDPWSRSDEPVPVDPLKHVTAATVERLLAEAGKRCVSVPDDARPGSTPFVGFPSPVEELCTSLWTGAKPGPESVMMLEQWSQHPVARVRAVARRLRAAHGLLTPDEVLPLLSSDPFEQLSAAECLVRIADEAHREEASAFWLAALGRGRHRSRFGGLSLYSEHLSDRLMWALGGASPAFAPLLGLVADHIPYDPEDGMETSEGMRVVEQTLEIIHRWSEDGMVALLDLMEARQVEDHHDFMRAVKATARGDKSFLELLRKRAAASWGPASNAYAEVREEMECADLDELTARLFTEVFPEGWPTHGPG
ncbi:hypothetical protein ACLESD_01770 [Pyxidicoccus sp. 3LFB2]